MSKGKFRVRFTIQKDSEEGYIKGEVLRGFGVTSKTPKRFSKNNGPLLP